ncbi:DivIVA domain-containing protein [Micromonospora echinofusca]|uniref:Cell wall synthesis protein Wag31 n=1 Tax=Micromonospora echinofusca TaxID=47858 RepID=A0ABS3VX52_MICEH|nr:DivIVA domain-containing protein [Micromonospora echinofusca]
MIHRAGNSLGPHHLRVKRFATRWRGLDPQEVYGYLREIADEIDRLQREVTTARTETHRIRQGLRQWQARHTDCGRQNGRHRPGPNGGHW